MSKIIYGKMGVIFTAVRLENMSLVENMQKIHDFCETNPPFIDINKDGKLCVALPEFNEVLLVGSGDYVIKIFDKLMVFTTDEYNLMCLTTREDDRLSGIAKLRGLMRRLRRAKRTGVKADIASAQTEVDHMILRLSYWPLIITGISVSILAAISIVTGAMGCL